MTYISLFFVLYWYAPFLKFGPLPSENPRCAPVTKRFLVTYLKYTLEKIWRKVSLCFRELFFVFHKSKVLRKVNETLV